MGIKFIIGLKEALYSLLFSGKKISGKVPGPCYNHWDLFMFHWGYGFYCFSAFWLGSSEVMASKKCCASHSVVSNSLWLKDCSPPRSSIHGILQARILEWVKVKSFSPVRLFVTPWTVAHQAPPSRGFSRQEYWSRLSFLPPGDLPDPGIKPEFPMLEGWFFATEPPGKPHKNSTRYILCPELIKETEPLDLSNPLTKSEVDMAFEPGWGIWLKGLHSFLCPSKGPLIYSRVQFFFPAACLVSTCDVPGMD